MCSQCILTGKGCVYSYDPVGSYERESCRAAGTASALLQPLLDNQIAGKHLPPNFIQTLTKVGI